jgi:hypothetical protein
MAAFEPDAPQRRPRPRRPDLGASEGYLRHPYVSYLQRPSSLASVKLGGQDVATPVD